LPAGEIFSPRGLRAGPAGFRAERDKQGPGWEHRQTGNLYGVSALHLNSGFDRRGGWILSRPPGSGGSRFGIKQGFGLFGRCGGSAEIGAGGHGRSELSETAVPRHSCPGIWVGQSTVAAAAIVQVSGGAGTSGQRAHAAAAEGKAARPARRQRGRDVRTAN